MRENWKNYVSSRIQKLFGYKCVYGRFARFRKLFGRADVLKLVESIYAQNNEKSVSRISHLMCYTISGISELNPESNSRRVMENNGVCNSIAQIDLFDIYAL